LKIAGAGWSIAIDHIRRRAQKSDDGGPRARFRPIGLPIGLEF